MIRMKAVGGQRFGSYDVGRMKAALRMAKAAEADSSVPKDSAVISGGKPESTPLNREGLQTIHESIKPTGEDLPNHQAGWVVGLMMPLAMGSIEASRQTMEKYNFLQLLKKTKGSDAEQIKQNALKDAEKQKDRADTLESVSGVTGKVGIATAVGLGLALVGGVATLPLGLALGGGTVLAWTASGLAGNAADNAKDEATNTNRFAKHVQAYTEYAHISPNA